jgi:hypothetical protein
MLSSVIIVAAPKVKVAAPAGALPHLPIRCLERVAHVPLDAQHLQSAAKPRSSIARRLMARPVMPPAGFLKGRSCRLVSAPPSIAAASAIGIDARRLVLGAAVGFRVDQVRIFTESLRASGYGGDVVMLVGPFQWRLCAYLRRHGVRTVSTWSTRKLHGPIHAYRFEKFARLVSAARGRYDYVLISDVRDVVFQRHPFEGIATPECRFYLEGVPWTFATEPVNRRWAKLFLSPADFDRISICRISCCGVVVGGIGPMTAYLERMAADLHALPLRLRREGGADTIFHNRIAHLQREVDLIIVENNLHVATLGIESTSSYAIGKDLCVLTEDGCAPAICHQYDRVPHILKAVEARFSPAVPSRTCG